MKRFPAVSPFTMYLMSRVQYKKPEEAPIDGVSMLVSPASYGLRFFKSCDQH